MEKVVVYAGTRNYYEYMVVACASLLEHTKVDKVYFLTEDDDIGYQLPECVEIVNLSGQTYFKQGSPNYDQHWTWMVLMRTALPKILPQHDVVLSMDADAIVMDDISELWDLPIEHYYAAGAREPVKSQGGRNQQCKIYLNGGIVMYNLKRLREDHKDDEMINELNHLKFPCPDQDVLNYQCQRGLLVFPSMYNANPWCEPTDVVKIKHYAAMSKWDKEPEYQMYKGAVKPSKRRRYVS